MTQDDILFSKIKWYRFEAHQRKMLEEDIEGWNEDQLLNTPVEEPCNNLVEKYRIDVPVLDRGKIDLKAHDIQIEITVRFAGDSKVFEIQPTTCSIGRPHGNVKDRMLTFSIPYMDLNPDEVRRKIYENIDFIDTYLTRIRVDVDRLNSELESIIRNRIEQRRERLLENQNFLASLGFKPQ